MAGTFKPKRKAKFNSGLLSLVRLHGLLEDCNNHSRSCFLMRNEYGVEIRGFNLVALVSYRGSVITVYDEVSSKLEDDERKKIREILKKGKKVGKIVQIVKTEEGDVSQINPSRFKKHWSIIHSVEIKLRRLADEKGLLIPDQDLESMAADID